MNRRTLFVTLCLNPTLQRTLRLPRLRVGEVNRAASVRVDASGKGINVSRVLLQLLSSSAAATTDGVAHLCQCGDGCDAVTRQFFSLVAAQLPTLRRLCATPSGSGVRVCTTLIDDAAHTATEIVEEGHAVCADADAAVRSEFSSLLAEAHTVVVSGSKAPGFGAALFPWCVAEAKAAGCTVVCDFRGADLVASLASRPDFVKINAAELSETFGTAAADATTTVARIFEQFGARCVVTNGADATLFVDEDGKVCSALPKRIDAVVNAIGSGDAFAAGFAKALRDGRTISEAVAAGHDCGARNALCVGPGTLLQL